MDQVVVPSEALAPPVLEQLAQEVGALRDEMLASEAELSDVLAATHPDNRASARNLVHYLALRRHDIRDLQMRLARVGLSSLGRSEPHVLVTLQRILEMLALARDTSVPDMTAPPVDFRKGEQILAANAERLLGPSPDHRKARIVVTLPAKAASDPCVAMDLVEAGMNCARINCARDDAEVWTRMAQNVRAAEQALERECRILVDLGGPKLRTGPIPNGKKRLKLKTGDQFELVGEGTCAPRRKKSLKQITCATPAIFHAVEKGHRIWFDDGRIGGQVMEATDSAIRVRVTHAGKGGSKLRPDRGINLPDTALAQPALGPKDLSDLAHVSVWADAIELSFAQREEDVLELQSALRRHGAEHLAVILKIETRRGFDELPRLLFAAMQGRICGVMIARGDLAVEIGFERMAEVQEEILWIAEAAHVPTIWATQVMESLAKEGTMSRAEVTDAAMSGRAEAVMLNKGPYVLEAIRALDDILARMQEHQSKKRQLYRALGVSAGLWE